MESPGVKRFEWAAIRREESRVQDREIFAFTTEFGSSEEAFLRDRRQRSESSGHEETRED